MMRIKIITLFLIFILVNLNASSEFFFLPKDGEKAKDKIVSLIEKSDKSIDIAMYNFSYKKFLKELEKASKRGVKVNLYLDKEKLDKNDKIHKFLDKSGIKYKVLPNKNHIKLALFDEKTAIFGSINYTKESFEENFELLYLTTKDSDIKSLKELFNSLEKNY